MTRASRTALTAEPDGLAPVREALHGLARRDAERMLAAADADVAAALAVADAEAEQVRDAARDQAATDADALRARARARADRAARGIELRARREAHDELVRRSREAVRELGDDPGLRDRLVTRARSELGPSAVVTVVPGGGVVAEAEGRRLHYELTALAEQAVAELLASQGEP